MPRWLLGTRLITTKARTPQRNRRPQTGRRRTVRSVPLGRGLQRAFLQANGSVRRHREKGGEQRPRGQEVILGAEVQNQGRHTKEPEDAGADREPHGNQGGSRYVFPEKPVRQEQPWCREECEGGGEGKGREGS